MAEQIAAEAQGRSDMERPTFEYFDKGSMATISRFNAVVKMGNVEITGFFGWVLWLVVHVMFLVGFRTRITSIVSWGINALSRNRWNLAATRQQLYARAAMHEVEKKPEH